MPRANNKKRTTGAARPKPQAAAPDSAAAPRDPVPSKGVPTGLARGPKAQAGDGIPAGQTGRRAARKGDDAAAGLAGPPGGGAIPGAGLPGAGLGGGALPGTAASGSVTVTPGVKQGPPSAKPAGGKQVSGKPASGQGGSRKPAGKGTGEGAAGDADADGVPQWAAKALQQLLTVTCWLDPGESGERFSATVRFTGHRTDGSGISRPGDTFTQEETFAGIAPGSGPVAITAEVRDINPGTWSVTAKPVTRSSDKRGQPGTMPAAAGRVPRPRRVPVPAGGSTTVQTAMLLRSKVPGITRYAYAILVSLGVLTGLAVEALLLATAHYPLFRPIMFSVAAVAAGVIGGKTWYAAVHRGRKWDGWCIQGFVAGAAVVVAAVAVAGPGLPKAVFLAAATPALLIGMGIGRHACFWAGCCTGRPTASRWGIWSSDRRLGCRRMPVQLLEAWTALAVGTSALVVVLLSGLHRSGWLAVAGLATYTLIRQLILGLRDEPRQWRHGRLVTGTAAALALIAGVVLFAVSG